VASRRGAFVFKFERDAEQEYFADGMIDDIINGLSSPSQNRT